MDAVECEAELCKVKIKLTFDRVRMKGIVTPLEETCRAIARMTELFFHPTLLEQAGKSQEEEAVAVANVAIRSLTA